MPHDSVVSAPFVAIFAPLRRDRAVPQGHALARGGALSVKVVKHFGAPVVIERIVAQPVGKATRDGAAVQLAKAFSCAAGAVLDLGEHWGSIVRAELQGRVLPGESPTGRPG